MGRRSLLLVVAALVAALGTALVFLYANNANNRALAGQEAVEVLVAKAEIPAGTSGADAAEEALFETRTLPASAVAEGALSSDDLDVIADQVALAKIFAGEQIVAAKFGAIGTTASLPIPAGMVAVSVELTDPQRVAGFVVPGSTVSVFGSLEEQTGVIVTRALVVAVGQTAVTGAGPDDEEALPRTIITIAVSQQDAQRVVFATTEGEVSLALVTSESEVGPAPRTTVGNAWA